jgi:hypothetical protein
VPLPAPRRRRSNASTAAQVPVPGAKWLVIHQHAGKTRKHKTGRLLTTPNNLPGQHGNLDRGGDGGRRRTQT